MRDNDKCQSTDVACMAEQPDHNPRHGDYNTCRWKDQKAKEEPWSEVTYTAKKEQAWQEHKPSWIVRYSCSLRPSAGAGELSHQNV